MNLLPAERSPKGVRIWAALCVATLAAYLPCLRGGLLWDDEGHVTKPALRSLHGLWRIWFEVGATQQYYPLLHSAFWLEFRLWGNSPLGYHLVNVFLHATSAYLVFSILRRLAVPGASLAAFVFALHPVCVESVGWIAEQKNTLSGLFFFAAAALYLRFDDDRSRPGSRNAPVALGYALATLCFAFALLSKTVTASLPLVLLAVMWWRRGRLGWQRDVRPLLPWLLAGIGAGLVTAELEHSLIGAAGAAFDLTILQRCLLAARNLCFYGGKTCWPADLIFIYPRLGIDGADWRSYLCPAVCLALAAALWLRSRRGRRGLAAGALVFAGALFPALGFVNVYPFKFSYVADHFEYLACLGLIVPGAAGLALARARLSGSALAASRAATVVLLAAIALLTFRQSRLYRDPETLYRSILARNPDCWMAYNNLGGLLVRDPARREEAVASLKEALRLNPGYPEARTNLRAILCRQEAEEHFHRGNSLLKEGRPEQAMAEYRAAIGLQPDYSAARVDLGIALHREGRDAEAVEQFEAALAADPTSAEAHFSLGNALLREGRLPEAIGHYEASVRIKPDQVDAQNNLAIALCRAGRPAEAIGHLETALRYRPDSAVTRANLVRVRALLAKPAP